MAQHSSLALTPPPVAPPRESTGHLALRAFVAVLFLFVTAYPAVYNLLGFPGAVITLGILSIATAAAMALAIIRHRPHVFPWRRLPWALLAYVAFALLSALWSRWTTTTLLTWTLLAATTLAAIFVAHVLTWTEIVRALSAALKAVLALSLAIELWATLVVHGPILPNFSDLPAGDIDPHWYWVRDNLIDGGRIQGIVGNSNLLAPLCLLAIAVFGILIASHARRRGALIAWTVLAAYLFVRAASMTMVVALIAMALVLGAALLVRRASSPAVRTRLTIGVLGIAAIISATAWLARDAVLGLLGRSSSLTGRSGIWEAVSQRAAERPLFGNGFATPWLPWDPAFDGWIVDHGITVFHAHDMWLDAFLQLGAVGVAILIVGWVAFVWRSWFFAVDRPRWDLRDDRPFSALSLLPGLVAVLLLVQGITESTPLLMWGWMLLVMFSFALKTSPVVDTSAADARPARVHTAPLRKTP